ncbi:hypothetical protein [Fuerstiella marisgermanici]|uniref:hypothetical protein n=1 Tax=Fuerstiella marisgermanici TaxID=1891926 RepID=UPI00097C5718|nr:hypothetical protein [Fuerstiella marisgermanici]
MKRLALLGLILTVTSGCQGLMHELQPHRLWRLNYQEPSGRTDGVYFSISDPLDQPIESTPATE